MKLVDESGKVIIPEELIANSDPAVKETKGTVLKDLYDDMEKLGLNQGSMESTSEYYPDVFCHCWRLHPYFKMDIFHGLRGKVISILDKKPKKRINSLA